MPAYDNELKGVLFKNDRRRDGRDDPEYQGQATLAGVEYWLSAWVDVAKSGSKRAGEKYFSIKFKPKEERHEREAAAPASDDEIPF